MTVTETASAGAEELHEKVEAELEAEEDEEASNGGEGEPEEVSADCAEKGIDAAERNEGTCTENGVKIVVVNLHSPLKLETLEAELEGVQERRSISSEGETETANGVYATFEVSLTNLSHTPVELAEEQVILTIDENVYTQDFDVQNGYEQESFGWSGGEIQPQSTVTHTVTFDVPKAVLKKLTSSGNLDFINFGAEYYSPEEFFEQEEYGVIRTYQ